MNDEPIFLLGAHKSGTSLLRSILNGHSKLYTIPIESHFFQLTGYWIDNDYRSQKPKKLNHQQIISNFNTWIEKSNVTDDKYIDGISKGIFDLERFNDSILTIQNVYDHKECISKYFGAIHYSVEGTTLPNNARIVEKSVEHAEFALELLHMFPKAKFIHILRNPYSNIVSIRKFKVLTVKFPIIRRILRTLYTNYYFLYKNRNLIKNYKVIRYEDIVSNPEFSIKDICEFLDIDFEDILMKPTYLGQPWSGNSITNTKFNKISNERLGKWKNEIYPMEVYYINKLFDYVLDDYDYDKFNKIGCFWKPAKGENLKRYIANRLYKYYLL